VKLSKIPKNNTGGGERENGRGAYAGRKKNKLLQEVPTPADGNMSES